jgi:hypothetical protein
MNGACTKAPIMHPAKTERQWPEVPIALMVPCYLGTFIAD